MTKSKQSAAAEALQPTGKNKKRISQYTDADWEKFAKSSETPDEGQDDQATDKPTYATPVNIDEKLTPTYRPEEETDGFPTVNDGEAEVPSAPVSLSSEPERPTSAPAQSSVATTSPTVINPRPITTPTDVVLYIPMTLEQKDTTPWAAALSGCYQQVQADFSHGLKKAVAFGSMANYIKEKGKATGAIPHNEWQNWLETNCPNVPCRTVRRWMALDSEVVNYMQKKFADFNTNRILLAAPGDQLVVDHEGAAELWELLEGKTQADLLCSLKGEQKKLEKMAKSEKEKEAELWANTENRADTLIGDMNLMVEAGTLAYLKRDMRRKLLNTAKGFNRALTASLKGSKQKERDEAAARYRKHMEQTANDPTVSDKERQFAQGVISKPEPQPKPKATKAKKGKK